MKPDEKPIQKTINSGYDNIPDAVREAAPNILDTIKASKSILLHCHPSPDPDSVGSALAMKFALEQLGKKVSVIKGDFAIPTGFSHFPGYSDIVSKNFIEIEWANEPFDLFIIQDASSLDMISRMGNVVFPEHLKTIVIDHHLSNLKFAKDINLVEPKYPSTAELLFDLFKLWGIHITPEIAANLFIGMFTDTGGFRYAATTPHTFAAASELVKIYPEFSKMIFIMDNSNKPGTLMFEGLALRNIEMFLDGHLAVSAVSYEEMKKNNISLEDVIVHNISNLLKSVVGWDVGVCLLEHEPGKIKASLRTRDPEKFNLALIAGCVGGGGHKAAAGANFVGTLAEAKKKIVEAVEKSL